MGYYYKSAQELTPAERDRLVFIASKAMHRESLCSAILGELEEAYPTDACGMLNAIDELALRSDHAGNPRAERAAHELVGQYHPAPTMVVHSGDWTDEAMKAHCLRQPIQLIPADDQVPTEGAILLPTSDGAECDKAESCEYGLRAALAADLGEGEEFKGGDRGE